MFCSVLGSGMNYHLAENRLVRDIFELGDKVSNLSSADLKQSKHDRVNAFFIESKNLRDQKCLILNFDFSTWPMQLLLRLEPYLEAKIGTKDPSFWLANAFSDTIWLFFGVQ